MPTSTRTPVELVAEMYEAFAQRDLTRLSALVSPDVVIMQDDRLPWGGQHVGPEGMAAFVRALTTAIDSTVTPHALFAAGDQVIQYGRTAGTVRADGTPFDLPEVHVFTVVDGRITEGRFYIDSDAMLEVLG